LVSSISAYQDFAPQGTHEDAAIQTLDDPNTEVVSGATYGGLKALCEQAALAAWGVRCVVARPGLIVGPHDPTGRFTWWLQRMQRGGDVLAPGHPGAPVQFIDARDVAAWLLLQTQADSQGFFNLTGPGHSLTLGDFLDTARQVLNPAARVHWINAEWLLGEGVKPWSELPVWLPPENEGLHRMHLARALATGLTFTPLAQTIADTAQWAQANPAPVNHSAVAQTLPGMAPEREADLLLRDAQR
jgi:2'-hydroxyisoflavone reductase